MISKAVRFGFCFNISGFELCLVPGMVIQDHPDEYTKAIEVVLKDWFQYSKKAREFVLNSLTIDAVAANIFNDNVYITSNKI